MKVFKNRSPLKNFFKNIFSLVLLFLAISCKREAYHYEDVYIQKENREPNFKPAYVVDTITIERPVSVYLSKGDAYATLYLSENDLHLLESNNLEKIAAEPHVYFAGQNIFKYPLSTKTITHVNECMGVDREVISKSITVLRSVKPLQKFVLLLVNVDYYNKVESHLHGYRSLETRMGKSAYIKVVLPLCELDEK